MSDPQSAIIPEPGESALFLLMTVREPAANRQSVGRVLAQIPVLTEELAEANPGANLVSAVGIGPGFWDILSPQKRPAKLRPFKAISVGGRSAPSTGGDLLFQIISGRSDLNFELAMRLRRRLGDAAEVLEEVHGFRYLDGRDLTGFIDGTENPKGEERAPAALIGSEDPDFAGGSYVFVQRYVHDLARWARLADKEQELIIGRRKPDSEELSDEVKPPTAHIARVVVEQNGEELQIVRRSFPYGTVSESGLFFIAYCKTPEIPELMLSRMMGTAGDGLYDKLTDFVRAVSGANFFAPSLQTLKALG